jgi:hypothetical protein
LLIFFILITIYYAILATSYKPSTPGALLLTCSTRRVAEHLATYTYIVYSTCSAQVKHRLVLISKLQIIPYIIDIILCFFAAATLGYQLVNNKKVYHIK